MANSFRARNSHSTILWICKRHGTWHRNLRKRHAPSSSTQILQAAPRVRLLSRPTCAPKIAMKQVSGGMLVQDADIRPLTQADLKVATTRQPTPEEMRALLFAWKVCKHVKSNAIVYAREGQTVGVGAGQMSRVDSCKIGAMKAILPL